MLRVLNTLKRSGLSTRRTAAPTSSSASNPIPSSLLLLPRWAIFFSGVAMGSGLASTKMTDSSAFQILLDIMRPLKALAHSAASLPMPTAIQQSSPTPQAPPPPPSSQTTTAGTMPMTGCLGPFFIADAAAKAAPAVVNVLVQHDELSPGGSSGSGFILDGAQGIVLTNAHVVADAIASTNVSKPIIVTLRDGRPFEARLLAWDGVSDVAVLHVDANIPLPSCRLGSSASLRAGEWVVAMGSPLGMSNTLTAGIVSCVDRKAVELGLAGIGAGEFIQTDASINRGSSGGPLVNLAGEVVGVSCMKAVAADGVSFAIPIDVAREVAAQLLDKGRVVRPFIGVKLLQLNALNVAQLRRRDPAFPQDVHKGVLVAHVHANSPAEKAGLLQGDVIVSYGDGGGRGSGTSRGAETATTAGLIQKLGECVGKPLELHVIRPMQDGDDKNGCGIKSSAPAAAPGKAAMLKLTVMVEEAAHQHQQQHQYHSGFQSRPV